MRAKVKPCHLVLDPEIGNQLVSSKRVKLKSDAQEL